MTARRRTGIAATISLMGVVLVPSVHGQVVVQDDKGRNALLVPVGGFVGISTAEGSGEIAYFRLMNDTPVFGGLSLKAKASEGITALFGSGALRPGASVTATLGAKKSDVSVAVRFRRGVSEAGLIDSAARPVAAFGKRSLYTWDGGVHGQWLGSARGGVAIALGRRRLNNYDDLTKASMETIVSTVDSTTRTTVQVRQTKDGRLGTVAEETITFVDVDAIWVPGSALPSSSIRAFVRTLPERARSSAQRNSLGFDLGVHRKGGDAIADRLAAVILQVNEVRPGDKKTDLGHRVSLSLVANLLPMLGALSSAIPKP